jgi:hypothetical protein
MDGALLLALLDALHLPSCKASRAVIRRGARLPGRPNPARRLAL